ncbi:MAG: sugar transferase [Armatimonadota bacterium]
MRHLSSILILSALLLLIGVHIVYADNNIATVPEVSAAVLAPIGFGAIVVIKRRQRRLAELERRVGACYHVIKRTIDVTMAASLLLVSAPVFLIAAVLVRASGPGPILFKRRVIGKNGKSFDMLKFRSMVDDAEGILARDEELKRNYYVCCKLKSDPRVTRVGSFLRKSSLDELPQLINVILGDMAFVGPRPIHADEVDIYGPCIEQFKTVTPGLTGLWQTRGRSNTSYEERVKMDMLYIEQRSVLLDVWILLSTIPAVLLKRGAC